VTLHKDVIPKSTKAYNHGPLNQGRPYISSAICHAGCSMSTQRMKLILAASSFLQWHALSCLQAMHADFVMHSHLFECSVYILLVVAV